MCKPVYDNPGAPRFPKEISTKTTLPPLFWPLMFLDDHVTPDRCVICGRRYPLEDHHMVFRSQGNIVFIDGSKMHKPLVTLCGFGNNLHDADGNYYCHGKAHQGLLFFRNNRQTLEFLDLTSSEFPFKVSPISYQEALHLEGWKPVYA